MKIRDKLLLTFIGIALAFGVAGYVEYRHMAAVTDSFRAVESDKAPALTALLELIAATRRASIKAMEYAMRGNTSDRDKAREALAQIDRQLQRFLALHRNDRDNSIRDDLVARKSRFTGLLEDYLSISEGPTIEQVLTEEAALHKSRSHLIKTVNDAISQVTGGLESNLLLIKSEARKVSVKLIEYTLRGNTRDREKALEAIDELRTVQRGYVTDGADASKISRRTSTRLDDYIATAERYLQRISLRHYALKDIYAKEKELHVARTALVQTLYPVRDRYYEALDRIADSTATQIAYAGRLQIYSITFVTVTTLLAAVLLARSISIPLTRLSTVVDSFGRGETVALSDVPSEGSQELRQLGTTVAGMIRERDVLDSALKASEAHLRTLFETSPVGLALYRMDGSFVDVNPAFAAIVGRSIEETLDLADWNITPEKYAQQERARRVALEETGRYGPYEKEYLHRDGHLVPVRLSSRLVERDGERHIWSVVEDITQQRQAAAELERQIQALRKTERRLAEAQRVARIGSWELDLAENRLWWSDEVFRIFAVDRQAFDASYETFLETVHPDDREFVNRAYTESVSERTAYDIVHRLLFDDGRIKYVNERCQTFYDTTGTALRSLGTVQDITERHLAEIALKDSEQRLALLLSTLPHGIQENDTEGVITYSNIAHHRILGLKPGELVGRCIWDFQPDSSHRQALREHLAYLLATQPAPEPFVTRNVTNDGREVVLEITWDYRRNAEGAVAGFISVISDITARAQAEKALRERKRELDAVVENLPGMVFVKDAEQLRFVRFNRGGEKLLGKSREALIGRNDYDLFPKEQADFFTAMDRRVLATGEPEDIEQEPIDTPSGRRLLHTRKVCIRDEDGRPTYLLGISEDITERVGAERALRESEARYRTLVDNMSDGVAVYEVAGDAEDFVFKEHNRAGERITGIPREQLIGASLRKAFPGTETMGLIEVFQRVWRSGEPEHHPTEHYQDQRIALWVENYVFKLPSGEIVAIYADITERKRAEDALRESQQRLQLVLDSIPVRVFWKDLDSVYLGCNRHFAKDAGLESPAQILGKNDFELGWREQAERYRADDREAMRSGISKLNYEEPQSRPDGTRLWLRTSKIPLKDIQGRVFGIMGVYEDITERRRAEQDLRYRLTLEAALARVSSALAQAGDELLDAAIDKALEHMGSAVDADRSYLFQLDAAADAFSNTHEWCAKDILPQQPELQQVPTAAFRAAFDRFGKGQVLHVHHPDAVHEELAPLRDFMQRTGIRSLINVPILWENRLRGVVGFDSERADKTWPEEDIRLLQTVAESFGGALARQESARRLHEHAWYLESLDKVSEILTGERHTASMLRHLTELILEIFDVDRAWLLRPSAPGAPTYQVPVEATRPEFPGAFAEGADIPKDDLSGGMMRQVLGRDRPLIVQSEEISEPPDYIRHFRIQSQMAMALQPQNGGPWMLGVHQCARKRTWTAVEQRLFQAIAERVSVALSASRLLEQIRESERRLLEAEQIARLGSWELDPITGKAFWSEQEYRCLGYRPGACEAGFENFQSAVHPQDREWVNRAVQAALKGELDPYDIEHRIVWQDGSERIVHERAIVERDDDGKPLRMLGTTQDITERVRMERELESHRRHLERLVEERTATIRQQTQIIDQTRDAVGTADLDGHVTSWNRGAERMFGIPADQAIGQHMSIAFPEDQHEFLEKEVMAPLKAKGTHEIEVLLQRADGSRFPAHASLTLLYDSNGTATGMAGYAVDISVLKQREAELDRLANRLKVSNQELESFAYSVSHDLRAPLRAIDGFSLALVEDYSDKLDEKAHDYLQRVRNGAQRMGLLIDDMLQLSRVNRGELRVEAVDLTKIARSIIEELETGEPGRQVELTLDPNMRVRGDPRLLRVMLDNLLGNAWKFTSQEAVSQIAFQRQADDPEVFYISDNGVGFSMRYADKLFGAFQRLHRMTDFPGTGVGLATVQRIVHRHGGRIWAEAQEGEGATFYFSFAPERGLR